MFSVLGNFKIQLDRKSEVKTKSERHGRSGGDSSKVNFSGIGVSCYVLTVSSVDKKNQLNVTFCILYFSSNSCSTCFGQPCAHHQELTTA
jgi:hypothetical protein